MEFTIQLDKQDWKKFQTYLQKQFQKSASTLSGSFWFNVLLWMVVALLIMFLFPQLERFHWPTAIVVTGFFLLIITLFLFNLVKMTKAFEPSEDGIFTGNHRFVFDDGGIHSQGEGYEARHSWSFIFRIERAEGMILVFMDTAYAFVFPEHKLENPDAVFHYISDHYSRTQIQNPRA